MLYTYDNILYDSNTGQLFRVRSEGNTYEIFGEDSDGYYTLKVRGRTQRSHRFIWKLVYGEIPKGYQIDHINGIKSDNRLCNLRLASQEDNHKNKGISKANTSGYKGVSWDKSVNKWRTQVYLSRKRVHISWHLCKEDAALTYNEKAKELFGDFYRGAEQQVIIIPAHSRYEDMQ